MTTLRTWQEAALAALAAWRPTGDRGFLIEATPRAGKARVAIEVAKRMLQAGRITRIVIAVPTARLGAQWAEAFGEHGITINPKWHGAIGAMATDERGGPTTPLTGANVHPLTDPATAATGPVTWGRTVLTGRTRRARPQDPSAPSGSELRENLSADIA